MVGQGTLVRWWHIAEYEKENTVGMFYAYGPFKKSPFATCHSPIPFDLKKKKLQFPNATSYSDRFYFFFLFKFGITTEPPV